MDSCYYRKSQRTARTCPCWNSIWVSDVCDAPLLERLGKWEETFGISGLLLRIVEFPNVSPFFFVKPREVELELVPAFSRGLGDLFSDEILELLRVPSFSRGDKARLIGAAVSDTMHDPLVSPTCCVSESPSDVLINRSEDVGQSLAHDVMPSKPEPFSENRSRLTSELNVSTGLPSVVIVDERLLDIGDKIGISKEPWAP